MRTDDVDVLDHPTTIRGDERLQRHLHGLDGDIRDEEDDQ